MVSIGRATCCVLCVVCVCECVVCCGVPLCNLSIAFSHVGLRCLIVSCCCALGVTDVVLHCVMRLGVA